METIEKGCQMSYRINTNIQALWANATSKEINRQIDVSMERLSTGLRINRAADDAAGMQIANQLRRQYEGLVQANKNANDAIGLVKIADGALEEYQKLLVTARDKAVQAASDTNSDEARAALEEDVKQLMEQANKIATETQFNGINLLDGSFTNKVFQVGSEAGQTITMSIGDATTATLGVDDASIDLTTQSGANTAIQSFDAAIKTLDGIRSNIGSTQLALESRIRVNDATAVNVKAAESQIRDVDMAEETERFTKNQVILQANQYALSKSIENQSLILNLLR
jgi:flagellin